MSGCGNGSDNLEDIGNNFKKVVVQPPKKTTSIIIQQDSDDSQTITSSLKPKSTCCSAGENKSSSSSSCCSSSNKVEEKQKSSCCSGGESKSSSSCCSGNNNKFEEKQKSSCCGGNENKSSSSCCSSNNNNKVEEKQKSGCCGGSEKSGSSSCCKSESTTTTTTTNKQIKDDSNILSSGATIIEGNIIKASVGCPSDTPLAGSEAICSSCPGQNACKSQADNPDKKSIEIRMKVIKNKILVMSSKGGVGKSTVSSLLSYGFSKRNNNTTKVSVLDVDICGPSIPKLMGVDKLQIINSEYGWIPPKVQQANHDIKVMSVGFLLGTPDAPVIWKGPRKTTMIRRFLKDTFWGKQDYLIIDTPPGTSDEHLSIINSLKSCNPDGAVLVTTPQDLSCDTVKKEISLCRQLNVPIIGIIENLSGFVCPCCDEVTEIFKSDGGKKLAEQFNIPFLGKIPIDTNLGKSAENGVCSICDHPNTPGTLAIHSIIDKIDQIIIENKKKL
ncbi:nucleotide binding protein 1-like protein [Dictyostelium discoideum AX4]|uniref:Nucleotide binding protein 1-like protein n=1 Tax=Dictyostelium discoideum TaxID=44689 RepID=Q54NE0_DICDI|nr:nucleotide binding protein 1-like protein [Dictyostelium discoideum AX4]EAL64739.1 nucleotide binding protein 1-like protein [Dictyostelium discoideum AX4]|eukprot:XP_638240.1 nucleotide binding protein 1-like protein [Dictyostelium discoideum AX4]